MERRLLVIGMVVAGGLALFIGGAQILGASPPGDPLPPEKQALEDLASANRVAGHPADEAADPGRPLVLQTDAPAPVGLLGVLDAPISGSEFTPTNACAGWIGGEYVRVWAGAPSQTPKDGLLLVIRQAGSNGRPDSDAPAARSLVALPLVGGPPRIQAIEKNQLVIANPDGSTVRFDLASGDVN
jgi:hypothetical protein